MSKALLALLLLLVPSLASARVGIIYGKSLNGDTAPEEAGARHVATAVKWVLDNYGYGGSLIDQRHIKTEFARIGVQTWNFGHPSAYTEEFDAIVDVGTLDRTTSARVNSSFRSDSLTLSAMAPLKPYLFLLGGNTSYVNNTVCSTAVAASPAAFYHDTERTLYPVGSANVFLSSTDPGSNYHTVTSSVLNGRPVQKLMGAGASTVGRMGFTRYGSNSSWKDSTTIVANPDTVTAWKVWNTQNDGSPQMLFVKGYSFSDINGDFIISWQDIVYALAALDSATGGLVFDPSKLPIQMSVVVDGAGRRNKAFSAGGPDPSPDLYLGTTPETTFVYRAFFDSTEAYGIPVAMPFDLDSAAARPNDVQRIRDCASCKVIPFTAADSLGLGASAAAAWGRPIDPLGRFRNRSFYRPHGTANADTAISNLLGSLRFRADSIFGAGKVVPVVYADADDYSPKQIRGTQNAALIDSVFKAASVAGYKAIIGNVAWASSNPSQNPTNPRGYGLPQGYSKHGVTLLGHNGYSTFGSSALLGASLDSTAYGSPDQVPGTPYVEIRRAWAGAVGKPHVEHDYNGSNGVAAPVLTWNSFYAGEDSLIVPPGVVVVGDGVERAAVWQRASIFKMHLSDFGSGMGEDAPGWWTLKALWNGARAINNAAGRNIISFVYPDQVRAKP